MDPTRPVTGKTNWKHQSTCTVQAITKFHKIYSSCTQTVLNLSAALRHFQYDFWKEVCRIKGKWQTDRYNQLCASINPVTGYFELLAKACTKPWRQLFEKYYHKAQGNTSLIVFKKNGSFWEMIIKKIIVPDGFEMSSHCSV